MAAQPLPSAPPTPVRAPALPTIPANYALALLSVMTERGHDAATLLNGSHLQLTQLQDQQAQIAAWQYAILLTNALALDHEGGLAYELGLRSQVTKHGFVGFGLISCSTLRQAIEFSQRYFQTRVSAFTSSMRVDRGQVIIDIRENIEMGPLRALIMDMVVVEMCALFAKVMGSDPAIVGWSSEIWVPHSEPPAYAKYRQRLPKIHFDHTAVEIRFAASMLDEPIATADAASVQLAIDRCEQELAKRGLPNRTADLVRAQLRCLDGHYPDVNRVAQVLHLSTRTLKRRLQEEGSSFQLLLDEARQRDALQLLRNRALSIKQVALAVGYNDPANFARAFAKWTGRTPRDWRSVHAPVEASHRAA